jgi:hypothetical protein
MQQGQRVASPGAVDGQTRAIGCHHSLREACNCQAITPSAHGVR